MLIMFMFLVQLRALFPASTACYTMLTPSCSMCPSPSSTGRPGGLGPSRGRGHGGRSSPAARRPGRVQSAVPGRGPRCVAPAARPSGARRPGCGARPARHAHLGHRRHRDARRVPAGRSCACAACAGRAEAPWEGYGECKTKRAGRGGRWWRRCFLAPAAHYNDSTHNEVFTTGKLKYSSSCLHAAARGGGEGMAMHCQITQRRTSPTRPRGSGSRLGQGDRAQRAGLGGPAGAGGCRPQSINTTQCSTP